MTDAQLRRLIVLRASFPEGSPKWQEFGALIREGCKPKPRAEPTRAERIRQRLNASGLYS